VKQPWRSFDRVAAEYDEARPSYPDRILELLPLGGAATVLDLGAGTGKLTQVLARRYPHVIAVEPLDAMRAVLERVVPEADARAGAAEAIPLADASVDAVFAAQAYQWFANDRAVAEIARVLRPGGVFAIVTNEPVEPLPLPEAYSERLRQVFAATKVHARFGDESAFEPIERGPFGRLHSGRVDHEQVQTRELVLKFASSLSPIARLPDDERAAVEADLAALLPEGEYTFTVRATVRWTIRQ